MTGPDDLEDDDFLAAEYVLHLLDAQERAHLEERLRDDPDMQKRVRVWEARLAPVADALAEVVPPARVKAALLAHLTPQKTTRRGWFSWRAGIIGGALAVGIALAMLGPLLRAPVDMSPQFQAEIASSDGTFVVVAAVIPPTHEIVIDRLVGDVPEGRVLELWLIAQGASGPVSLGLLQEEGTTRIRVPDAIAPGVRTGTVAISEEPPGGSVTGAPTGRILATGTFVDL